MGQPAFGQQGTRRAELPERLWRELAHINRPNQARAEAGQLASGIQQVGLSLI